MNKLNNYLFQSVCVKGHCTVCPLACGLICFLLLMFVASCDGDTGALGTSTTPRNDSIDIHQNIYYATSRSLLVDSIIGKTSTVYLGRYTDPETNTTFQSDFITQFNCAEGGNVFPPADSIRGDSATRFELRLFYTTYQGDSLNAMQVEVYALDQTLQEGKPYYSNVCLDSYVASDARPLATKSWAVLDYGISLGDLNDDMHYHNVCIPLPHEMGTDIIRDYRVHPEHFENATSFIDNICKGFYLKCTQGDGTVLWIDHVNLNVCFQMARTDSTYTTQFTGSQEVLQVNHFDTQGLQPLVDDNSCTWLKTPGGIFTEVTLPIDEITENEQDTINAAKIIFNKYNPTQQGVFSVSAPPRLLMLRKSEMYSFFENNQVPDNVTSFLNTLKDTNGNVYLDKYNQYAFTNISRLIVACRSERDRWMNKWQAEHPGRSRAEAHSAYVENFPEWDKVVLIPVSVSQDSQSTIVSLRHDLSMSSAKLKGGKEPIEIQIITSTFK